MYIKDLLLQEHSVKQSMAIVKYIGNNEKRFEELIILFFHGDTIITQRASLALKYFVKNNATCLNPYFKKLINNLSNNVPVAVKRNTLRIFQDCDVPKECWGKLTDVCLTYLKSNKETIAVKVFSMSIVLKIGRHHLPLLNELKISIEDQLYKASPGFRSRASKVLKEIYKIEA